MLRLTHPVSTVLSEYMDTRDGLRTASRKSIKAMVFAYLD